MTKVNEKLANIANLVTEGTATYRKHFPQNGIDESTQQIQKFVETFAAQLKEYAQQPEVQESLRVRRAAGLVK